MVIQNEIDKKKKEEKNFAFFTSFISKRVIVNFKIFLINKRIFFSQLNHWFNQWIKSVLYHDELK